MPNQNDMQAVIDAAREGIALLPVKPSETPVFVKADGEVVDLRRYLPTPERKAGTVIVFNAASFNQAIAANKGAGNVTVYVDRNPDNPLIDAVLNGHGPEGPGWGDFRVRIAFRPTPQWKKWKAIDGKMMGQTEFAEFIEENVGDIQEPSGATMLEVSSQLQVTRTTGFRRAVSLSSGVVQLEHAQTDDVKAGQFSVPEKLLLALVPMQGGAPYAVPARFRYRLEDGKLRLGIRLERIEDLMDRVLEDVMAGIAREGLTVLDGHAPAAVA